MAFYALERLIHLHDGYRKAFSIEAYSLLLLQEEGKRYLMLNQCPHQQAPLLKGAISEGKIYCPYHGMGFDLHTGMTVDGCNNRLRFFTISYQDAMLGVDL